jgi:hypothetical protein
MEELKFIYPTNSYIVVKLDPEQIVQLDSLILPNTEHYETDGGKIGSRPASKTFENEGILLRSSNKQLEEQIHDILEKNNISNEELNKTYNIKVVLRDKAVIEKLKLGNTVYEDIIIANVNDIRLIKLDAISIKQID